MSLQDQSLSLSKRKLMVILPCLTTSLFVSFFDQTAVSTAIPSIANDLHSASVITSWVGTSYLIANTNFQLLYGRFSDIFGRKQVFLFSLAALIVGNLVSGFAKSPTLLLIFRGISGLGGGGINCLVMITFSDLLTPRERGKYFGIVAVATSLGNGLGPFVGGALSQHVSWNWVFWITAPIAFMCMLLVWFYVPLKPVTGNFQDKLKQVDWVGSVLCMVTTIFFLVPLSGGGSDWSWKSATFLALIIISGISFVVFLYNEHKWAKIPIIPIYLFTNFQRIMLFLMCLFMGWAYFVDIYYLPLYLQNARGWGPMTAGAIQIPATCSSSIFGVVSGYIVSHTGRYVHCLWVGGFLWALGTGLKLLYTLDSNVGIIIGTNIIQGCGIGFTFQPTLLALLANSESKDRAVVTGLRNFFRCLGGSIGLVICSVAFKTCFNAKLVNMGLESSLITNIVQNPDTMRLLDTSIRRGVLQKYLESYHVVIIMLTVLSGVMFVATLLVGNGSLDGNKETKEEVKSEDVEIRSSEKDTDEEVEEHNIEVSTKV